MTDPNGPAPPAAPAALAPEAVPPAPAPPAPEPAPPPRQARRSFAGPDGLWTAYVAGDGLGGTGRLGVAPFSIVHFVPPGASEPGFQALIKAGQFEHLYDRELAEMLAGAQAIVPPPERG